jgi:arylsulfatase
MDLFTTSLKIAGVAPPADRTLDGKDILPLLTSNASSPHEALFGVNQTICSVRSGDWKLHVRSTPREPNRPVDWKDPRAPDGKTIVAPSEQYSPAAHPGITTGDVSDKPALFNLREDPTEQHNVAAAHPDVVERLMAYYQKAERRER